ncbi:MAG: DNA polymerase/3'-5' exonuclease PolX [Anaerolineales bacterium]
MLNREVAKYFEKIADLLQIKGEAIYRVLAYRRAGESILALSRGVDQIAEEDELEAIPGVGKAIAAKINELLTTGKLEFYERLITEVPESLPELLRVEDVGPKKVARFWKELGITSIEDLDKAARAGDVQKLSGMGPRSETKILESIEALRQRQSGRHLLGTVMTMADRLLNKLRAIDGVEEAELAGSLRRWRETIGDLDLVVASNANQEVMDAFVEFPEIGRVRGKGTTKTSVELVDGLKVQLWVQSPERFGTTLQYATGSAAHNVKLRELAQSKGLSLSEHGFKAEDGTEVLCAEDAEVYEILGIQWIPPEMREDRGEIQAGIDGSLPELIEVKDLRGELHAHSDWSDGHASIEEMALAARKLGMTYLVITDHSRSLGVANGLSIEKLWEQKLEIERVQEKIGKKIILLHGSEVEILADGSLDYPDEVLEQLDLVFASLHSSLRQSKKKITDRFIRTIQNPHVDCIGHLSGRLLGKRDPADFDLDSILTAAADYNVVLEINSHQDRLDLNDINARRAVELGVKLAITTDAHRPEQYATRVFGVGTARRAWVTSKSVVNAWPKAKFLKWLQARN